MTHTDTGSGAKRTSVPLDRPKADAAQTAREIADKGTAQARETYEKMSAATSEATDALKSTYSTVLKGAKDYNAKVIQFAQANTSAAFDFAQELLAVKSPSEFLELSTQRAREQFETLTEQTKELAALAQKAATEAAEPLKAGMTKTFSKVA